MRYWESVGMDPRGNKSLGKAKFVLSNQCKYQYKLLSKEHLVSFWLKARPQVRCRWDGLPAPGYSHPRITQERRKIVGSIGLIVEQVLTSPDADSEAAGVFKAISDDTILEEGYLGRNARRLPPLKRHNSTNSTFESKTLDEDHTDTRYPKLLSTLLTRHLSIDARHLGPLFEGSENNESDRAFIEILYFSPLHRVSTTLDTILRRQVHRQHSQI